MGKQYDINIPVGIPDRPIGNVFEEYGEHYIVIPLEYCNGCSFYINQQSTCGNTFVYHGFCDSVFRRDRTRVGFVLVENL